MNSKGLTLTEILLSTVLMSILILSLFRFSSSRIEAVKAVRANTIALFTMESAKNYILLMGEEGNKKVEGADSTAIFPRNRWKHDWRETGGAVKIRLADLKAQPGRIYSCEVKLP
ncbi:MAG: hypothetical protein AB1403_14445 [Candidatus Riflebacteria bacterium]